jgi:cation:H+ antiporter
MLFLMMMYLATALNWKVMGDDNIVLGSQDSPWLFVSVTSVIVIALYALSVRFLAGDNGADSEQEYEEVNLSLRSIIVRFVLASLGIIVASIILTYVTDDIATELNLGSGLAGALFLGVATSLPEVTSTISLFRMRNFDIAFGNIAGSNVFNFFVLAIADVIFAGGSVYHFGDDKVINLTVFGMAASTLIYLLIRVKQMWLKALLALCTIACYLAFLMV